MIQHPLYEMGLRQPRAYGAARIQPADAVCEDLDQMGELGTRRRRHPPEPERAVGALGIHPVEKQHIEVDVQVQSAAEALDQGDCTGLGRLAGKPGFLIRYVTMQR